jgi:heme/copper-type cytochrome/quinol oxidase subunit 3
MDLSPVIAWAVPLIGLILSTSLGLRAADRGKESHSAAALGITIALGMALTFVQALLHTQCIESFRLCRSRGDVNMSYWFQSFFAIPVFWLFGYGAWRIKQ